ncbi:hypothetical protein AWC38_SpisGene4796 [Stylophora pistillata]|uniref:Uncharacterized protein n=1 Tax=Stylophora pistillata TaxID=50429 RepID=A0A2B4SN02_STYPI|nr:hypothetical protein AWC38_SpisGene4796 [Stylophora pistillata]
MFKLVVFFVCVFSALSQELDKTAAEGRTVKQEAGIFQKDEEGGMFIKGDEEVNEVEMPEGSNEGNGTSKNRARRYTYR